MDPEPPLQRKTLGEQLAGRLRREVFYGTLTHEDRLTQERLCLRFGTSRIPVRDAILQLIHEGVLVAASDGVRPARLTDADLRDMFRIEGRLHSLAASLMIERASEAEVDALDAINQKMRDSFSVEDFAGVTEANVAFHREINLLAKSPRLIRALRSSSIGLHVDFLMRFPQETAAAIDDHDEFLVAVRNHEVDRAMTVMEQHVRRTADSLPGAKTVDEPVVPTNRSASDGKGRN